MRTYELMMITHGSLDEQSVQAAVERFTTLVQNQGGAVDRVDHWGKRQFAYEIDHMWEGYYTVVDLQGTPEVVAELERQLGLTDEVVRYKLIRPDTRVRQAA